jgi:glycosyltransferase involved in cell wall biosynthesis
VVSDLPVMHEVLAEHGRYVPVGDVDALAEALGRLPREDDEEARSARRLHASTFTWARFTERTRAAYDVARSGG